MISPEYEDIVEEKAEVRDLGIKMANDLTFNTHVSNVIRNMRQKASWTFRTFQTREEKTLKTIWRSLILPIADYCSPLWFAKDKLGEIREIENV